MPRDATWIINTLLDLRSWAVFDVDTEGRILAGYDESGSIQLIELSPHGSRTPLTELPSRCSGRYVPGSQPRQVIVQRDNGGDELMQLSKITIEDPSDELRTLPGEHLGLPTRLPGTRVRPTGNGPGVPDQGVADQPS